MKIVTLVVHPDERCHGLREGPREGRWVQRVYVERDGGNAIAEWSHDYGPVEDFEECDEIIYMSWGDDTVGQLQELAERDRHTPPGRAHRDEVAAESTLIQDIIDQEERKLDIYRNRSQLGPVVNVQRIDYPRETVARRRKEKRDVKRRGN